MHPPSEHFQGKTVIEHLKEARARGTMAVSETHGTEMPGHISALCDAAKDTAFGLTLLWIIFYSLFPTFIFLNCAFLFSAGWLLWKTGRSALLGWSRMQKLHRLIEEERWEIEHHRSQEREELTEMYRAKGLEGKLLNEVIDVLMADDNRLLQVMLEEELGLSLEVHEHPLKQAFGAFCGSLCASALCIFGFWLNPTFGLILSALAIFLFTSILSIRQERNSLTQLLIWNLAIAILTIGSVYFLIPLFS